MGRANLESIARKAVVFKTDGKEDSISIIDHKFLSFICMDGFESSRKASSTPSCLIAVAIEAFPWSDIKEIIDKSSQAR